MVRLLGGGQSQARGAGEPIFPIVRAEGFRVIVIKRDSLSPSYNPAYFLVFPPSSPPLPYPPHPAFRISSFFFTDCWQTFWG